jgi:hypothetical protein
MPSWLNSLKQSPGTFETRSLGVHGGNTHIDTVMRKAC